MVERRPGRARVITWLGWGALAALGYAVGVPLLLGGAALFPLAVLTYERGFGDAAVAAAAGVFGVALLDSQISLPAIGLFVAGSLLGHALRAEDGTRWMGAATILAVAAMVGFFTLPAGLGGYPMHLSAADARSIGAAFGLPAAQAQQITKQAVALIPAFIPVYAGVVAGEAFFLTRWVLGARGKPLQPLVPFTFWQAPAWLAPLFLLALGADTVLPMLHTSTLSQHWAGYVVIWTQIPLAIFGLAVVGFLMARMRLPSALRFIILVLMLLSPFAVLFVWVGVLDNMTDLRHIRGASTE